MASLADLQAIAAGQLPAATTPAPTQAILIGNNQQNVVTAPCFVSPSNGVNINLTNIASCDSYEVRFNFFNNATFAVVWALRAGNRPGDASFIPQIPITPNVQDTAAFVTDGTFPAAANLTEMEIVGGMGGYAVSGLTIQTPLVGANGALPQNALLSNDSVYIYGLPFDPHNNAVETTTYSPYCDCCTFNNNNGVSTKCYDLYVPVTWRSGLYFGIPAGAFGSVQFNIDAICYPNTFVDTAANGWPA